jgi:NAD(P)-dependent dehydrogenase (short-subunit alcohol dehydrogenase family)
MKRVLITGVNGGMGRACAEEYKKHGYFVYGIDRAQDKNEFVDEYFSGSVTDEEVWRSISAKIKLDGESLDALVNIAGRNYFSPIESADLNEWRDMFDVNVNGMVCAIKYSKEFLENAEAPAIVNMSSISGYIGSHGYAAYCATKGAVDSLTKSLSLELAPKIRVNAVAPGWIETPFTVAGLQLAEDPVQYRKNVEQMHALNRVGTPQEIAKVIYWLSSEDSSFMTGSVVICDGGYMVKN